MNNPNNTCAVASRIALVNAIIEYWKSTAERSFRTAHPHADHSEFEQRWPKVLLNFFLAETVYAAKKLRLLSEGRNN